MLDQRSVKQRTKTFKSIDEAKEGFFFIDAPGGTSKTFTASALIKERHGRGEVALAMASSGIAALLLPKGVTAHSMCKIPVTGLCATSTRSMTKQSWRADLLRLATMIIWDEAPMTHRRALEAIDRTLRDIRDEPDKKSIGLKVTIPRITPQPSDPRFPFTLRRRQFPVRVAFAMAINKSQGQSLERAGLLLPRPVFSHGQLYVAFLRSGCPPSDGKDVRVVVVEVEGA